MSLFPNNRYIFDGGMGQYLIEKGMVSQGTLWSATALIDENLNNLVLDAHLDFIHSGAQIIVTNNFKVRKNTFNENGILDKFDFANKKAGELAFQAKKESKKELLIAGSISTRGVTYKVHQDYNENEVYKEFFQTAKELNPFVDLFYLDVLCSTREIITALDSIKNFNKPALLGLHFKKNFLLPSGETIGEISNAIKNYNCCGLMASCVSPEIYNGVSPVLKKQSLAYGFAVNAFINIPDDYELKLNEEFSKQPNAYLGLRKEITPKKFTKFAINSFSNGAKFLKGCCNIMPDHIRALSNSI